MKLIMRNTWAIMSLLLQVIMRKNYYELVVTGLQLIWT